MLSERIRCLRCGYRGLGRGEEVCPVCQAKVSVLYQGLLMPGARVGGHYVVDFVLGAGGFGVTYQAIDEELGRRVALKEYFPRAWARRLANRGTIHVMAGHERHYERSLRHFESEGKILANINHPNVVRVFSLFRDHGTVYLVMELLDGVTLGELLREKGQLEPTLVEKIMGDLASALGVLHQQGILHLDLKPDNVILTKERRLVLVDFGAARWDQEEEQRGMTRTVAAYTLGYAPLELLEGSRARATPATDIYELSVLAYELLTGKRPPDVHKRLEQAWVPEDVPTAWRGILEAGLALRASDRPQTIEDWWGLYRRPVIRVYHRWYRQGWRWFKRRWRWWAMGLAGVVLLWWGTSWLYGERWQEQQAARALEQGHYQLAIEGYSRLLRQRPRWGEGWFRRGKAHLGAKQFAQALEDYRQALQLEPNNPLFRRAMGELYLQWATHLMQSNVQEHFGQITQYIEQARLYGEDLAGQGERLLWDAYVGLAKARLAQGDPAGALEAYRQLWQQGSLTEALRQELRPQMAAVYHTLAQDYQSKGQWDLAMKTVDEGLQIDKSAGILYGLRGQLWRQRRQWDKALADYNQALQFLSAGEEQWQIRYERALVFTEKNQVSEALQEYERLLKGGFERDFVYNAQGLLFFRQRNYTAALNSFNQAIRLNPNYMVAFTNRGWTKFHLGDHAGAAADFENAIRLGGEEGTASAYQGLGYARTRLKEPPERILTALEKAKELYRQQGETEKIQEIDRWIAQYLK